MAVSIAATPDEEPASDRIHLVDALRGFSLLGIVLVHFAEQYLGFLPPADHREYSQHGALDKVLEGLVFIFIRGKGFALFSFMFGLSYALQMQRAERRDPTRDFRPRFAWRLAILFGIGVLHRLLYSGDILTIYALLGLPLLLFYRVPDRWLWIVALVLMLGAPRVVMRFSARPSPADLQARQAELEQQAARHYEVLRTGSFPELAHRNAWETLPFGLEFQFGAFARGYQSFGYFILGMWAGRRRLFEAVAPKIPFIRRAFRWTLACTLGLPVIGGALFFLANRGAGAGGSSGRQPNAIPDFTSWPMIAGLGAYDLWNFVMTACYVTLFVLLYVRPRWRRWLERFAPIGRMALTAYVAQTIAGALMFFGIGLGLLGTVGNSATLPVALALFTIEIVACRWWLRHFHYGPLEWVWRSATLRRAQPFSRVP